MYRASWINVTFKFRAKQLSVIFLLNNNNTNLVEICVCIQPIDAAQAAIAKLNVKKDLAFIISHFQCLSTASTQTQAK